MVAPGTLFANDYRIEHPLAEGGMGAVFVAEQLSTGKRRALKVMHPSLLTDTKLRERFVQEARIGAKIDSNHVVEVIGAGIEPSGEPWMAMELLEGETLAQAIRSRAPLSREEVLLIFRQLTHALSRAHDAKIVHRDLKPENIFLAKPRRDGITLDVKVLDFGIAKVLADAGTRSTRPIGTPFFMAPEQMGPGRTIGPPTDVWALGLIAFACLTGKSYWLAATTDEATPLMLLNEVAVLPMPTASQRAQELGAEGLPPGFDEWFAGATSRSTEQRFQDARAAFAALEPVLAGAGVARTVALGPMFAEALAAESRATPSARSAPVEPASGRNLRLAETPGASAVPVPPNPHGRVRRREAVGCCPSCCWRLPSPPSCGWSWVAETAPRASPRLHRKHKLPSRPSPPCRRRSWWPPPHPCQRRPRRPSPRRPRTAPDPGLPRIPGAPRPAARPTSPRPSRTSRRRPWSPPLPLPKPAVPPAPKPAAPDAPPTRKRVDNPYN